MADMSNRYMGMATDRLRATIDVSLGLSPTSGTVRANRFPQGKMQRKKVPVVKKGKVKDVHRSAIAETVFTDTLRWEMQCTDMGNALWITGADTASSFP
jgi:hypothetical protein